MTSFLVAWPERIGREGRIARSELTARSKRLVAVGYRTALLLSLLATASALRAHPFHITTAQAQLNRDASTLEIALELNPSELERSIELRSNRDFSLEQADAEKVITQYAQQALTVSSKGIQLDVTWVGMELGISSGWLYFQIEEVESLNALTVSNRFLVEFARLGDNDQLNTVVFQDGKHKQSQTFIAPSYRLTLGGFE